MDDAQGAWYTPQQPAKRGRRAGAVALQFRRPPPPPTPPPPATTTTTTTVIHDFIVGPVHPSNAAALAGPPPDAEWRVPGASGAASVASTPHHAPPPPPATARLPDDVLAAVGAKLKRGQAGVGGEGGAAVLRTVFGGRLPWGDLF